MVHSRHGLAALFCLATAAPAFAAPTTWEFRGTFTSTEGDLPPEFVPGTGYRLLLDWDMAVMLLDTATAPNGGQRHTFDGMSFVYTLYVDGITEPFVLQPETDGGIFLRDDFPSDTGVGTPTIPTDGLSWFMRTGFNSTDGEDLGIVMRGSDTGVFSGPALPLAPVPAMLDWELKGFQYCRWEGSRQPNVPCASGFIAQVDSIRRITGPQLASMTLKSNVVSGCRSVAGTLTLDAPAPAGGRVVTLSDSLESASVLAQVKIPAGKTSRNFSVKTLAVAADESGTIGATLDGATLEDSLTVRPMGLSAVTFPTSSVVGGGSLNGTVKLECPAGPGDVLVELTSSLPGVAQPSVATVTISAGEQTAPIVVNTAPVVKRQRPLISATANETLKTKRLTVNP